MIRLVLFMQVAFLICIVQLKMSPQKTPQLIFASLWAILKSHDFGADLYDFWCKERRKFYWVSMSDILVKLFPN